MAKKNLAIEAMHGELREREDEYIAKGRLPLRIPPEATLGEFAAALKDFEGCGFMMELKFSQRGDGAMPLLEVS